jgi:hypothetical protein
MKRLAITTISLLLGCIMLAGCKREKSATVEPRFITKEGHFPIDGDSGVKVFRDVNGLLNITHYVDGSSREWTEGIIKPASEWFVYVEQRNEAWMFYNGRIDLVFDHEVEGGTINLFAWDEPDHSDEYQYSRIPLSVRERLPLAVTQRIKKQNKPAHATPRKPSDQF